MDEEKTTLLNEPGPENTAAQTAAVEAFPAEPKQAVLSQPPEDDFSAQTPSDLQEAVPDLAAAAPASDSTSTNEEGNAGREEPSPLNLDVQLTPVVNYAQSHRGLALVENGDTADQRQAVLALRVVDDRRQLHVEV